VSTLIHIAERVLNTPLLLLPSKAETILAVLAGRIGVNGPDASRFEGDNPPQKDENGNAKRNMWGDPKLEPYKLSGSTAIVTITGSLVNRGAWVGANSGLTSYEGIQFQLKRAAANPDVKNIILDLHSPGGEAVGAFETASLVRQISADKPVTALVNGMAASAAYAIASGASQIVTTETGVSGSIGVVLLHADYSRMLANDGITPTLIFAGAHKVDANPFEPLSEGVKSELQAEIDAFYAAFLDTVAAGRGSRLTQAMARATEARTFIGAAGVEAGLADAVGSFESVLADLTRAAGRNPPQKGRSMKEENGAPAAESNAGTVTKADHDAAMLRATNEGKAATDAALKAERERIAGLDKLAAKSSARKGASK
jgi:signal peptide peptidase SppA